MSSGLYEKYGRKFSAGDVLFEEGSAGSEMYVILSGRVRITRRNGSQEAELAILPPGEFLGEMAIITNQPRTATATVVEDAKLLVLDAQTFEAMIRGNAEIAVRMIKKLADRLQAADAQIELLLHRDPNHRVVRYLRQQSARLGRPTAAGTLIPVSSRVLADRVGLSISEVEQVVAKLEHAKLVLRTDDDGFILPEVGKLQEFLEFLEMKERFGSV